MRKKWAFEALSLRWWLPLLVGASLTFGAAWLLNWQNQYAINTHTTELADEAASLIEQRFNRYEYGLRSARGTVITAGVDQLTREQFENYTNSRETAREFPGALGFGFIRRVPAAEEARFQANARADGAPNFTVRTLNPHNDDRFIIQYIYPEEVNKAAVGLDIGSEANRREAALKSAREGQARLTDPITLVQADGKPRRGFLILLPVYADQTPKDSPEARENTVRGWTYAPLVVDDVLAGLNTLLSETIISLTHPSESDPFYRSGSADNIDVLDTRVTRNIVVMGQQWQLDLVPRAGLTERLELFPVRWLIVGGLFLTLLMLLFSHAMIARYLVDTGESDLPDSTTQRVLLFLKSSQFRRSWPPFLLAATVLFILFGVFVTRSELNEARLDVLATTDAATEQLQQTAARYRRATLYLASSPAVDFLKRLQSSGLLAIEGTTSNPFKNRLADILEAYMLATPDVHQVRLIEHSSGWRELVKVERTGDQLTVFDEASLQVKAGEPYINNTVKAGADKVYISPLNLNREFGTLEQPSRPTWRFSTLIVHDDGTPFGILIINLSATNLLDRVAAQASTKTDLYITNTSGDFVLHPQSSRTFAFEFGHPFRWEDEFKPAGLLSGFDLNNLSHWQGQHGVVWVAEQPFIPEGQPQFDALTVYGAQLQHPVYQIIAVKLGLALVFLIVLSLAGGTVQYQAWWSARQRHYEDQLQARQEQQRKEGDFFKSILESSPDATVIVDNTGIILKANVQAERLFGYVRTELEGAPVDKLIPENLMGVHLSNAQGDTHQPLSQQVNAGRILTGLRADGTEFSAEVYLGPIQQDGKVLVYASIRDITERLTIEEKLRQALKDAEKATDAKSAFLANTSHEIRTPLNAVIGLTHLLAEEPLTDGQLRLVSKIQMSGQSLLGIVNDVLDLSKIEANEMSIEDVSVNLPEFLDEIGSVLASQAQKKGLQLDLDLSDDLPAWVITDSTRLRQILVNLLSNALKFTKEGHITLRARVHPSAATLTDPVTRVRITVADTGIGISPEAQARLFQPFTQADTSTTRRFGGTGLGLSIVRHLAELLGGTVGLESEEGVGSQFWVELPLRIQSPEEIVKEERLNPSLFVMIAGGEASDVMPLVAMTRALGWKSQIVRNSQDLTRVFETRQQDNLVPPDALIVDWQRSAADSITTLYALTESIQPDQRIPVIMLSTHEKTSLIELDNEHKLAHILPKPVNASALFNTVNTVITEQTGDAKRVIRSTRSEAVKAHWLPGVHVLVVDDSPINLEVVSLILQRNGAQTDTAGSGELALTALRDAPDKYDAVLMDIQMPGMDGIETTRAIREALNLTALPVIALTAGALVEEKQRALAADMNDFLTKPIDPSKLIEGLRSAVEHYRGADIPIQPLAAIKDDHDGWPDIPGLNAPQAKRLLLGSTRLFFTILNRMLTEHAGLASPPPASIDQPEEEALRLQVAAGVHKLRSSGAMVGSERIHQLASVAENALRTQDQPVTPILTELAEVLRDLQQASEQALSDWRQQQEGQSASGTNSDTAVFDRDVLQQLISLLANSDMDALMRVEQHQSALRAALGDGAYQTFKQHIDQLDFNNAVSQLKPLLETG